MKLFAREWVSAVRPDTKGATIIALEGDLGAGKTTFVQGVAQSLGVVEVTSPTFVIQKNYPITHTDFEQLVHIDAYRLENTHELLVLDFEAIANNPKNLMFIEWPERVPDITPSATLRFTWVSENERLVEEG